MADAPLVVGVSGLRGIVGASLTPEVAVRYAATFGGWLRERTGEDIPHVILGRDGRAGGEQVEHAAIAGLLGSGCRVTSLGVAATPTVGVAVSAHDADAGMIITASHNPQQWNGLKCLVAAHLAYETEDGPTAEPIAHAPAASDASDLVDRFHNGGVSYLPTPAIHDPVQRDDDAHTDHWRTVLMLALPLLGEEGAARYLEEENTGLSFVLDSVNSSGSKAAIELLRECGRVVPLYCDERGVFPHTPEPTAENLSGAGGLCTAVPGLGADVGFAQDPDADRLALVDETGRYIGEEYTLALAAMALLGIEDEGDDRQPVLCANLSTSRMIDDIAAEFGGRVVRTAVGEANVVEAMLNELAQGERVVLGGEGNGGVIWPGVVYVRDSIGAMALVIALMVRTGKTLSELVAEIDALAPGGKGYAIDKRKAPLASKADAAPVAKKLAAHYRGVAGATVDETDGVRIDLAERGLWVHVRASNTEPIMRLIAEGPTQAEAAALLDEVTALIG